MTFDNEVSEGMLGRVSLLTVDVCASPQTSSMLQPRRRLDIRCYRDNKQACASSIT